MPMKAMNVFSFNRTTVECKGFTPANAASLSLSFNRTTVECKDV